MNLYPKFYLKNVKEITTELLTKNNIKGLILDVDNTLIDKECTLLEQADEWCKDLKKQGIKICILSNTANKKKAETVAQKLDIPYLYFGKKPLKMGFKKAKKLLEIENNSEIAVVGDQIFTDILGANRVKMIPILVQPISRKDLWYTRIKRPLEDLIIKRYLEKYGGK